MPSYMDNFRKKIITQNELGLYLGYNYEFWQDRGTSQMVLTGIGTYDCQWEDTHDVIFRVGEKFRPLLALEDLGDLQVAYEADYRPEGRSYMGIYGWTREPLVEFYILENWGGTRPDDSQKLKRPRRPVGSAVIDGAVYDLFVSLREEAPSIEGSRTFSQYWSVRREPSSEGKVSVADHFRAWQKSGQEIGRIYEIALAVEGFKSRGQARILRNQMIWPASQDIPKAVDAIRRRLFKSGLLYYAYGLQGPAKREERHRVYACLRDVLRTGPLRGRRLDLAARAYVRFPDLTAFLLRLYRKIR